MHPFQMFNCAPLSESPYLPYELLRQTGPQLSLGEFSRNIDRWEWLSIFLNP